MKINPTAETIRIARDAAQADFLKIDVESHDVLEGAFWVRRQGETLHMVCPDPFADGDDECNCGAFAAKGYCEHVAAVELTRDLWAQEAEYEARTEAEAFMRYTARDHAAAMATGGGEYL
jgi:hypothetical protein